VNIPSNPDYSSLNIASAVQVIAYELRVASQAAIDPEKWDYELATGKELEGLYQHLEQVMIQIEFLNPKAPRQLMARLKRLFNRTRLDVMEVNILRGILGAVEKYRN
jgi:tRNA C32,U32 (ribose-2'-O)-methylase TrmJ